MEIWEVKGTYNVDGIAKSETWLYQNESQAHSFFTKKAEEDFAEVKGMRSEEQIHVNAESYDDIDDGDYIVEYTDNDYCSYEQGYGGNTLVEFTLRLKEVV